MKKKWTENENAEAAQVRLVHGRSSPEAIRTRSFAKRRRRAEARRATGRLRGPSWALLDQCVVSAANFLTIYLLARHMGTVEFGVFMLAYTGLLLLTSMQTALLTQPHNVLGASLELPHYRRFTAVLSVVQAAASAGMCALLGAAGLLVWAVFSPGAGSVLVALALAAVPWMGQEFVRRVLYTRAESRSAFINDSLTYGLQFLGALLLAYGVEHATSEAALGVLGASSLVGVLLGVGQLRGHVRFQFGDSGRFRRTWKEVWDFGKWLTAQNLMLWMGGQGHAWIVGIMLGAESVGFYRAVTHLVNVMNPLRQAAYNYLPSRGSLALQTRGRAGLSRWVTTTSWILIAALVPFCIALIGFPQAILTMAYGEKYAAPYLVQILALATVAQCITFVKWPLDIGILALRESKWIFYVHLIPVFLLLTFGVGLIYLFGITGVPLSSILINTVVLFTTWVAYARLMARSGAMKDGSAPGGGSAAPKSSHQPAGIVKQADIGPGQQYGRRNEVSTCR